MKKIFSVMLLCAAVVFASCSLGVDKDAEDVKVIGISLNKASLIVEIGDGEILEYKITPEEANDQEVTWSSSDPEVATVDNRGLVEGVKVGTAIITATTNDGGKTDQCSVTVVNEIITVNGVTLAPTTATVEIAKTTTLTATVNPANASDKTVTWTTSDSTIATVLDGVVTGVKEGSATITATSVANNAKKATCVVTVAANAPAIVWATGNLVADGANGAKIGAATDKGLYFQFGSLIGWSATDPLAIAVSPVVFKGTIAWGDNGKIWQGATGTVPFTVKNSKTTNEEAGVGDPCRYYLEGTWRLPTKGEYDKLFENSGYGTTNDPWKWNDASKSATHKDGLIFLATGYRNDDDGELIGVNRQGNYWSASPVRSNSGFLLLFYDMDVTPSSYDLREYGYNVRCVKNTNN